MAFSGVDQFQKCFIAGMMIHAFPADNINVSGRGSSEDIAIVGNGFGHCWIVVMDGMV